MNYFYGLSERCDAQVAERDATECVLRGESGVYANLPLNADNRSWFTGGPDLASKRTDAFSAVFISNCNSVPRTSYLQRLMELIPIHSYGAEADLQGPACDLTGDRLSGPCLHSPDLPQDHGRDQNYGELKQQVRYLSLVLCAKVDSGCLCACPAAQVVKQYRFFISLENTAVDGYLTEKFYEVRRLPSTLCSALSPCAKLFVAFPSLRPLPWTRCWCIGAPRTSVCVCFRLLDLPPCCLTVVCLGQSPTCRARDPPSTCTISPLPTIWPSC